MKVVKSILFVSAFVISCATFAAKTSNISLGGGTAKPTENLSISLDKLVSGGSYHVVCKITDNNNQKNKVSVVLSAPQAMPDLGSSTRIVLNGSDLGYNSAQVALPQTTNTIEFFGVTQQNYLSFTNLDQDDTIVVSDCMAAAE